MALALVWVVVSLVGAALILQYLFTINVERSARDNMGAAVARLAASIVPGANPPAIAEPMPDPRYSTPFGGRYWQIEAVDTGAVTHSRSMWDQSIDVPANYEGVFYQTGPDNRQLILLTRQLRVEGAAGPQAFRVTVGEDYEPIHRATQAFVQDAGQLLALLGAAILVAAYLLLRLGLGPVSRVRQAIEAVRHGDTSRLEGKFPSELDSMVDEINGLLQVREVMRDRARARAADLAHGLKTPLAAMHGIADRLRENGNEHDADLLQDLSFEMSERVDYQLRLSVLRPRTGSDNASSSLNTAVLRTVAVLKKTSRGEDLHWVAQLGTDCAVDIHRQDLMELVGVLMENATKWASSRVVVQSRLEEDSAILEICDDGPGIPDDHSSQLGERGHRLDESLPGTGLGLSIAREILALNGGTIAFGRADLGGLMVSLCLPLSRLDPREVG
ncbi:sensor histidine kinase [Devosia sp.]|uniref:sensor histidine kinase n=1 Tax=Devosia sp. TaxID=1871048 RepID=UPI002FC7F191